MEQRQNTKKPTLEDLLNGSYSKTESVTQATPAKKKESTGKPTLEDLLNGDYVKKKDGTQDYGTGSQQSDTTVSELPSTTPEPKKSTTNLERETPFNSLTLSPGKFQDQLDASLNVKPLPEPEKKKVSSAEFLYKDINTHAPNVFEDVAKANQAVVPKLSQFDKEEISKQTTKDVFYSPNAMAEYTKERVNTLRSEINNLEKKKLKSSQVPVSVGTGTFVMPSSSDKEAFEKANKSIAEKQAYIDQLKNSVAELASERIVSQTDLKNVNFKDLGRKIAKIADPELDQQFKLAEKGGNLPGIRGTQLESLGLNAVKQYLKKYPNTPNAKQAAQYVADMESSFDERNIEATAARVRQKIGKFFYDEGKSGVLGYSQENLDIAINSPKTGLTPSEKKIAESVVLPTEKRIWGTDIPGSGFGRAFRGAIEKSSEGTIKSAEKLLGLRSESDIAYDALAQPGNTRYQPVQGIGKWQELRDGIGDLTGQVAMMALTTKGVGTIGKSIAASGAQGGLLGGMTRTVVGQTLANENVGLFLNSFLNSYDNYNQQAVQLMPGENQGTARKMYAVTMATVEGLSEKIFNDTKILKAFSKEASPAIRDITSRFINNEITSQVARQEIKGAIKKTAAPFLKEYGKSTVQEASEEAVVDIANGVAESVFGGTSFDIAKTGQQAVNTFVTTALYSPLVAGLAAHGAVRQNNAQSAFMKSSIAQMAVNPGEYLNSVDELVESGEITSAQANEKRKLISSASNVFNEMPVSRTLQSKDKNGNDISEDTPFTLEETTSYIVHRLNEQIIEAKLEKTTDKVLISDLNKELKRSVEIRKGIYDGSIKVNEDIQEVAPDAEVAEELNIVNPESVASAEPTIEEKMDDIQQGKLVTFTYSTESEIPDVLKDKVSSVATTNGVTTYRVTIPESEANFLLNPKTGTPTNENKENIQPEVQEQEITEEIPESVLPQEPITVTPPTLITNETKEYVTTSGNQKVVREDGKLRVLNVKDNSEATPKMQKKALKEYAQNYDYSIGEKAAEPESDALYSNEQQLKLDMVDKSNQPAELASLFLDEDNVAPPLSTPEQMILDYGQFTIKSSDYVRYGDKNNLNNSKARSYIRSDGTPIDSYAQELSDHYGVEITPQDIVDFMDRFPNGIEQAEKTSESEVAQAAAVKFFDLTGLELTQEIAAIAVDQDFSKLDIINNELLKESYETGRSLTDAYAETVEEPAAKPVESKSKTVTPAREVGQEDNGTKQSKSIAEGGKDAADWLRELKSSRGQANANIFGLAVAVYDGVIETIATAIEAGANLAQAIKTGLDSLSKEDRSKVDENAFKQHIEDFMSGEKPKVKVQLTEEETTTVELPGGNTTGIKHASTENIRQEFGLGDEYQKQVVTDKELEAEADAAIKEGYNIEKLILKIQGGNAPSPLETVILGKYQAGLVAQIEKNPTADNLNQLNIFRKAVDSIGSIQGREFRLRQRLDVREDSLAGFFMQDLDFNGGNPLTEEQQKRTEAEYKNISEAKDKLEKALAKSEAENKRLKTEKAERKIREVSKNAKSKKTDAEFAKEREKIINDIKSAWNKSKGNLMATIIPIPYAPQLVAIAPYMGKLTVSFVNQGITKLSDLVDNIHSDLVQVIPKITKDDVLDLLVGEYNAKPTAKTLTKEAIALKDIYIELKKERAIRLLKQKHADRGIKERIRDFGVEIFNIPRSLMSSLDFSAVLRQAIIPSIAHPITASKAAIEMFRQSGSQKRFDRWFYDLKDDPRFKLMQMSGLYVADPHDIRLSVKEESFMNNMAERIPFFGGEVKFTGDVNVLGIKKLKIGNLGTKGIGIPGTNKRIRGLGGLVKGSERAYVGFLNKMRVDLFNRIVDGLENEGITFDNNEKLYKALASMINNTTGRGNIGVLENKATVLNSLFFAPRYTASILNILGLSDAAAGFGLWGTGYYGKMPWKIRQMALLDVAKFLGAGITIMALINFSHKAFEKDDDDEELTIELDPRSSDFGKMKIGTTRWNLWGSYQPTIRYLTQFIMGESKNTKTGKIEKLDGTGPFGRTRANVAFKYLRSKAAPVPSMGWDFAEGKNAIGEKVTWEMEIKNHVTPLFIQDLTDAYEDKGVKSLFTVGLPSMFGVSVQTQAPKNFKDVDRKDPVFKFLYDKNVNLQDELPRGTMNEKEYKAFQVEKDKIFKQEWEQVIQHGALLNQDWKPTINTDKGVSIKSADKLSDEELSGVMKAINTHATLQAKKDLGIETKKK